MPSRSPEATSTSFRSGVCLHFTIKFGQPFTHPGAPAQGRSHLFRSPHGGGRKISTSSVTPLSDSDIRRNFNPPSRSRVSSLMLPRSLKSSQICRQFHYLPFAPPRNCWCWMVSVIGFRSVRDTSLSISRGGVIAQVSGMPQRSRWRTLCHDSTLPNHQRENKTRMLSSVSQGAGVSGLQQFPKLISGK